ncbi:MAG: MOSC N-terminal beta barrel domain-containing protein [Acidimicrobiia bacterium]|nr:MOSC N-terminal beta barrel domain-containing protein [Acidimicrobiia bacterium]
MTVVGVVAACWRYPVKSMQGLEVDHLDVDRGGVEGDRAWGLIDLESGAVDVGQAVLRAPARTS